LAFRDPSIISVERRFTLTCCRTPWLKLNCGMANVCGFVVRLSRLALVLVLEVTVGMFNATVWVIRALAGAPAANTAAATVPAMAFSRMVMIAPLKLR
jgi:hypothetical protein